LAVSGFRSTRHAPFQWVTDNQRLFPDVCSEVENGFVVQENCFVGTGRRNILTKKLNDFSKVIFGTVTAARYTSLAAAMIRGAKPSRPASPSAFPSIFLFRQARHATETLNPDSARPT
jgi:hypothetical protein